MKVVIEGECEWDPFDLNNFEAQVIDQAKVSLPAYQKPVHGAGVPCGIHPYELKQRYDLRLEILDSGKTNTTLQQSYGFNKYIG